MKLKPKYFEDFEVGLNFESEPTLVTKDEIIDFASKYDPQTFHLDEEASSSKWNVCGSYFEAKSIISSFVTKVGSDSKFRPTSKSSKYFGLSFINKIQYVYYLGAKRTEPSSLIVSPLSNTLVTMLSTNICLLYTSDAADD